MADRLFLGPLRGREAGVAPLLSGYLANGGVQATASIPPIRSAVAWSAGIDPVAEWDRAIGDARTLGRCVDEHALAALVAGLDVSDGSTSLDELDAFLRDAVACTDGRLGEAVTPWVEAVRAEAAVGRTAVQILRHAATTPERASMAALGLAVTWPPIRRSTTSVFGPRQGFRPVLGLTDTGAWTCDPSSFDVDRNAIDALVRTALAAI
jgi:hypothetical protein